MVLDGLEGLNKWIKLEYWIALHKKSDFMSQIYTSRRTTPLVQWYSGDKSNPRRKALTTFSTCTSFPDIGTANLEPGWTCHPNNTKRGSKMWSQWEFGDDGMSSRHVSGSHNLREPDYYYTHESDRKAEFWTQYRFVEKQPRIL